MQFRVYELMNVLLKLANSENCGVFMITRATRVGIGCWCHEVWDLIIVDPFDLIYDAG